MKSLILILSIMSFGLFAQENEVSKEQVQKEVDILVHNAKSEEEKKFLTKFKSWTSGVAQKDIVKKSGRGLGKASSIITTETLRPFVATGSFFRGLFGKDNEGSRLRSLAYSFYLENEKDLNDLYKDPQIIEDFLKQNPEASIAQAYKSLVEKKFKSNILNTIKGILIDINFNPEFELDRLNKRLTDASSLEELMEYIQALKIEENPFLLLEVNSEMINQGTLEKNLTCNNMGTLAPHIQLTPLINALTKSALSEEGIEADDFKSGISKELLSDIEKFISQFVENEDGMWKNTELVSEVAELSGVLVGKFAVPSIILGSIVPGAGAAYLGITALSSVGTGLTIATCTKNKNQKKLLEDPDFRNFCSYVLMRNSQKLLKSKARGFIAGQNIRDSIKMIKYKKNYVKDCMNEGNSRRSCKDQYNDEKNESIYNCMDLGHTKKECKRIRRRDLLASK
jgi:hypothetical protein